MDQDKNTTGPKSQDFSAHTPMIAQYMGVISKLLSQINFL